MREVLHTFYVIVAELFVAELTFPFITALAARIFGKERLGKRYFPVRSFDFACVITAYRNIDIARPLVESLLRQTHSNFTIYLVADDCLAPDFGGYDDRVVVLRPETPLRLKIKSIIYATQHFRHPHDYIVVFDADNLAHPEFLQEINKYANADYRCIQGQRRAKNLNSSYAALDSLGEHYKNYTERYVPHLLGCSAVISGSGMATEAELYLEYLHSPEIAEGQHLGKKMLQEDKILQNFILRRDKKIAYARKAIVYDEKVDSGKAVETQRSRWLYSYFQNVPNAVDLIWKGLTKPSFNQLYFGLVTFALPMFMLVGLGAVVGILGIAISPHGSEAVVAAMLIFIFNILWCLRLEKAPPPVWKAIWLVPLFIWRQFTGLFKMADPDKNFRPTEHKKMISVDEVLEK
ncbi:MAG: glycosyltransferase [Saprospiraceae bacterium]|nr:glycosyltransferase [Saprospiraceae bacterium]